MLSLPKHSTFLGSIRPQAFFSFLAPHSHLATRPSSFPQSHAVPRVTTSRNKKTSSIIHEPLAKEGHSGTMDPILSAHSSLSGSMTSC